MYSVSINVELNSVLPDCTEVYAPCDITGMEDFVEDVGLQLDSGFGLSKPEEIGSRKMALTNGIQ